MSRCCLTASELVEAAELISSGYKYGVSSSLSSWSWRLMSRGGAFQGLLLAFEDLMPLRWFLLKCGHQNQDNILRVGWWRPSKHFALSLRCAEVWDFEGCFPDELLWPDSSGFSCHWVGKIARMRELLLSSESRLLWWSRIPHSSQLTFWLWLSFFSFSSRKVYHLRWWLDSESHYLRLVFGYRSWPLRSRMIQLGKQKGQSFDL